MTNSTDNLTFKKQHKTTKENKEAKFCFQFVDHENGKRSEPFVGNWDSVQKILDRREDGERPNNEDYILLVAVLDGKDTTIPATPLITVETFTNFKTNQPKTAEKS